MHSVDRGGLKHFIYHATCTLFNTFTRTIASNVNGKFIRWSEELVIEQVHNFPYLYHTEDEGFSGVAFI